MKKILFSLGVLIPFLAQAAQLSLEDSDAPQKPQFSNVMSSPESDLYQGIIWQHWKKLPKQLLSPQDINQIVSLAQQRVFATTKSLGHEIGFITDLLYKDAVRGINSIVDNYYAPLTQGMVLEIYQQVKPDVAEVLNSQSSQDREAKLETIVDSLNLSYVASLYPSDVSAPNEETCRQIIARAKDAVKQGRHQKMAGAIEEEVYADYILRQIPQDIRIYFDDATRRQIYRDAKAQDGKVLPGTIKELLNKQLIDFYEKRIKSFQDGVVITRDAIEDIKLRLPKAENQLAMQKENVERERQKLADKETELSHKIAERDQVTAALERTSWFDENLSPEEIERLKSQASTLEAQRVVLVGQVDGLRSERNEIEFDLGHKVYIENGLKAERNSLTAKLKQYESEIQTYTAMISQEIQKLQELRAPQA